MKESASRRARRVGFAALSACLLPFCLYQTPAHAAEQWARTTTHAYRMHANEHATGLAPLDQSVHVVVALKLRHRDALKQFIRERHDSSSAHYMQAMSAHDFMSQHAPTSLQAAAVAAYLRNQGFTNVSISANRSLVSADGTTANAETAFHTGFVNVQRADGSSAHANTAAAQVPASLADSVLSVIGLQNVHSMHTLSHPLAGASTSAASAVGHDPVDFASIYADASVPTAAGVTVGIIAEGNLKRTLSDLDTFTSANGLASVNTQVVGPGSHDTSGLSEWNLDSQDIVGMAGGEVGTLVFYDAASLSNADLTSIIATAVDADAAPIVNVSLGECETYTYQDGSMAADDQLFEQADAQGQTFSVSSGDDGSDECGDGGSTPSYPASSPYVVAVGGTTLYTSGTTSYASESTWSGTGGSPSLYESAPSWQSGYVSGSMRGVPDIAFDADPNSGAQIYVRGRLQQWGGTSLASPLFVGSWARLLAAHPGLGFAAPYLYQLPSTDYNDVTSGSNGAYSATAGWDYTTGFGSFKLGTVNQDIGS